MSEKTAASTSMPKNKDKSVSPFKEALGRFFAKKSAVVGAVLLIVVVILTILAPVIAPYNFASTDITNMYGAPTAQHLFGCDELGRDIFSRVLYGGRFSLQIGLISSCSAALGAIILGTITGYIGGKADMIIMRILDVIQTIPGLLLSIAISAVLGNGLYETCIALAIGNLGGATRIYRAQVMQIRGMDYIDAAVSDNTNPIRLTFKHIVPNSISPLIVNTTMNCAHDILTAATLSFIGLGVQPPNPEWGAMLSAGRNFIREYPWMLIFPGLAILVTTLALNLLGDGMRDALDPKLKK